MSVPEGQRCRGKLAIETEDVLTSATLMYRRKLIKSKRVKYIGEQIGHLKRMIQNWRKSDKQRYTASLKK